MTKITINGKTHTTTGQKISIINNRVMVDGKEISLEREESKVVNINIEGPVEKLEVGVCEKISVNGNVGNIRSQSGDINVTGPVVGSIQTMSGNVTCGDVEGNISTMSGNIRKR